MDQGLRQGNLTPCPSTGSTGPRPGASRFAPSCWTPAPDRSARGRRPPDVPAARPDSGDRAQRRPRRVDATGRRLPPGRPDPGAGAGPHPSTRCARSSGRPPTSGSTSLEMAAWPFAEEQSDNGSVPGAGAARMAGGERRLSARTSSSCCESPGRCCHATSRTRASCRGSRQAGPATATSPRCWSSSPRAARSPRLGAADGSGSGISPSASTPPSAEVVPLDEARRVMAARRLRALGIARPEVIGVAGERNYEEVDGEPAEVEGTSGSWVVDAAADRPAVRGAHGAAVAVRSPDPRPRPSPGAVRLRVLPGDVQAEGQAPLGLLRASRAAQRPAGRQARRDRRPEGHGPAGGRDPRGRPLHARHHQGRHAEIEALAAWLGVAYG